MKTTRTLGWLAALAMLGNFAVAPLRGQTSVETVATNFFEPYGVAMASDGTIYVTDGGYHRIVKLTSGTTVASLFAGQTATSGTNDGVGSVAQFNQPQGIVVARGGLVVADSGNHTLRFISFAGQVSTLAGAPGSFGLVNGSAASARFRFPSGLAADSQGNIYIADAQNNAIRKLDTNNNVTTVVSGLFQPAAVAVGDNGDLWITDTRRHCIKRLDTNGVLTLVAGISGVSGANDSSIGTNAQFTLPRALLWLGSGSGLLVSDSGNHTVRRVSFNTNFNAYGVETYAGTPTVSGNVDGPAFSAKFNTPVSLARDTVAGGFLIADKNNNALRRINTGPVQPPIADPVIGWIDVVKNAFGEDVTLLRPVVNATFFNDVPIGIKTESGVATYYTYGATPPSEFEDNIPVPAPNDPQSANPPEYEDGAPARDIGQMRLPISAQPDLTIKAISVQSGRRSSALVQSRFQFKTANPVIIGDNAASFSLDDSTIGAQLWYTTDGSEPTNSTTANPNAVGPRVAGDIISFDLRGSNVLFKVRAFRNNFAPSAVISKVFSPSNFMATKISFGFESGEASSEFVGAAGQRFYAPVTLTLLPGQRIYSFQFSVVATNLTGPAVDGSLPSFRTALERPGKRNDYDQWGNDGAPYRLIHPQMAVRVDPLLEIVEEWGGLVFTNSSANVLGVGWIERLGFKYLYDTLQHDLVTYSQPHDTVFRGQNGQAVLGAYSFVVPSGAAEGDTYQIQVIRPSATSDGVSKEVFIQIPTNGAAASGAINGTKRVTVGSRRYVVGDCAPFRWFNAGDFGDTNLVNNDVLQVFQSAIYQINMPPAGSDFFGSMDSSDGTSNGLFDGSDTAIDSILYGDGVLNVDDVYVTFRRALDPSRKWFARYWQGGSLQVVEVPNAAPASAKPQGKSATTKSLAVRTGTPSVAIQPDDVIASAGSTVQVPIRVHVSGGLPLRVAALSISVQPLDGSPELTQPVQIVSSALGAPAVSSTTASNNIAVAWLDSSVTGISGDAALATLVINVPSGASSSAAYRVHVKHFSASPNGLALMRVAAYDGVVTLANRSGSTANDGISDLWRFRWFGTLNDPRSGASIDADGDGRTNLEEYQAGTNPRDRGCRLALGTLPLSNGVRLSFPTGAGRTYILEWAGQLNGPWTPFWTNAGDGNFREVNDTPPSNRFYRIRAQ